MKNPGSNLIFYGESIRKKSDTRVGKFVEDLKDYVRQQRNTRTVRRTVLDFEAEVCHVSKQYKLKLMQNRFREEL